MVLSTQSVCSSAREFYLLQEEEQNGEEILLRGNSTIWTTDPSEHGRSYRLVLRTSRRREHFERC